MPRKPASFEFEKAELDVILPKIQAFMDDEFEMDIGNLRARIFLTFVSEVLGPVYYNRGIEDAAKMMTLRVEDLYSLTK